jgi:hypothetical protein
MAADTMRAHEVGVRGDASEPWSLAQHPGELGDPLLPFGPDDE